MKRPHISEKTKVTVAIMQTMDSEISCPLCMEWLQAKDDRVLEHMVPHELGGASDETNLRWVHKACAAKKTNGSKATSAGGDIHKIAKTKRLTAAQAEHAAITAGDMVRAKLSRNPMRKHPTLKRTVGGAVVNR